jgi:multidrug efflux pump subunit AcrB
MALNVPLTMLMSLLVAFTVTPWLSWLALRNHVHADPGAAALEDDDAGVRRSTRLYRVYSAADAAAAAAALALHARSRHRSCSPPRAGSRSRAVPLKMLPFDNKTELQVLVDLPEGSTLERTDAVVRRDGEDHARRAEVVDVTTYVGVGRRRSTSTAWCATTTCAAAAPRRDPRQPRRQARAMHQPRDRHAAARMAAAGRRAAATPTIKHRRAAARAAGDRHARRRGLRPRRPRPGPHRGRRCRSAGGSSASPASSRSMTRSRPTRPRCVCARRREGGAATA